MTIRFSDIIKMARMGNPTAIGLLLGDERVTIGFNENGQPTRFYGGRDLSKPENEQLVKKVEDTRHFFERYLEKQMLSEGILPDEIIEAADKLAIYKNPQGQ